MTAWLIDTMLYSGLLIGVVLALRRPVGRFFGAQYAYALWALPFLRLLLPPIVLPASFRATPETTPVAATPDMAAVPVGPVDFVPVEPTAPAAPAFDWALLGEIALSVWAGGALAFLAWRIVGYRRMRRELLAAARPVGEIGNIRLVETPALEQPVAFGVHDKVIGLPLLFMAQPDISARDLAIAHEVAHHKGHDLLANFAAQALLALHWFNPLAWMGWRAMRRDQEAACDARVLAGRGRDERALYAALIVDIAAGPRLALAAPMACPVLGDKSIIHRLRSLSMSDITPRRRLLGRVLVGAGAFALPLTASISYSAVAQGTPATPIVAERPEAPEVHQSPETPDAPEGGEQGERHFVLHHEVGPDGMAAGAARQFEPHRGDFTVQMPAMPQLQFHALGDPTDPEFEARMEAWGKEMEKWGEKYGAQMEAHAEAWAESGKHVPEVVQSCDEDQRRRTTTADGRPRVVICQREIEMIARSSLRQARDSIAHNPEINEETRREVLENLDAEIERIEREDG